MKINLVVGDGFGQGNKKTKIVTIDVAYPFTPQDVEEAYRAASEMIGFDFVKATKYHDDEYYSDDDWGKLFAIPEIGLIVDNLNCKRPKRNQDLKYKFTEITFPKIYCAICNFANPKLCMVESEPVPSISIGGYWLSTFW